jgi:hypothetical protein
LIRTVLRNDQWERIAPELPGKAGDPGVTARDNRLFVEAVLWIGPGHRGVTCRKNSATGTPSTRAFGAGHERACGSAFSSSYRAIPTSNTSFSTRRTSGSTSMEPAQKGDSQSGYRQIAWRSDDQDCSRSSMRSAIWFASYSCQVNVTTSQALTSHGRHRLPRLHWRQGV